MTLVVPPATDLALDLLAATDGGCMSVQELCRAGMIMDVGENQMRVALTRLVQQRKLTKAERGLYAFHPDFQPLADDVVHWLDRVSWMTPWDGTWIAVVDPRLATADRTRLRRHQRALDLRGFRTWRPGFHLRPANLAGGVAGMRAQLPPLGLAPNAEVIGLQSLSDDQQRELHALWDIEGLRGGYRQLTKALQDGANRLARLTPAAAARDSLLLGRSVIAEIMRDPLLPPALMGGDDLQQLVEGMQAYQALGRAVWDQVLERDGSRQRVGFAASTT